MESGLVKPEEKAYLTVLKESNLKPEEVVYFDDKDENIEAAKALGLNSFKYESPADTENVVDNFLK